MSDIPLSPVLHVCICWLQPRQRWGRGDAITTHHSPQQLAKSICPPDPALVTCPCYHKVPDTI